MQRSCCPLVRRCGLTSRSRSKPLKDAAPTMPRSATSTATASTRSSCSRRRAGATTRRPGRPAKPMLEAYKLDGTLPLADQPRQEHPRRRPLHPVPGLRPRRRRQGRGRLQDGRRDRRRQGHARSATPSADYRNAVGLRPRRAGVPDRLRRRRPGGRWPRPTTSRRGARWPTGAMTDGNRVDRFLACVAYLDGERPSVVMCRGYYTRTVLAAWNWRDGKLTRVWTFDTRRRHARQPRLSRPGEPQPDASATSTATARTRSSTGPVAIDDDGKGLYSTGLGHGDALHLSDIDPDRPGLEVFDIHERPRHPNGAEFRDARTGRADLGKAIAGRRPGRGAWTSTPAIAATRCGPRARACRALERQGRTRSPTRKPRSCNFGVWWDGDLLREILDGNRITKWDWQDGTGNRPC